MYIYMCAYRCVSGCALMYTYTLLFCILQDIFMSVLGAPVKDSKNSFNTNSG